MTSLEPDDEARSTVPHGGPRHDESRAADDPRTAPPRLGRYTLHTVIGRGGFGVVYRSDDPVLRRPVAIKVLRARQGQGDLGGPDALIREARMAAMVEHPNVVRVYDVGRVETPSLHGDVFIVMELLSGRSFNRWKRSETPSAARIVEVMLDVAEGLAAAHARDVVHCDVKPANVFVDDSGRAKVVDFGLALHSSQRMSALRSGASKDDASAGFVAGTPAYMAPEAHEAEPLEPACDQYSFAVMLAEAIAGAYPFERGAPIEVHHSKYRGLDPAWLEAKVPRGLHSILLRATNPLPEYRYPSMHALSDALRQWLEPPTVLPWIAGALALTIGAAAIWSVTSEPSRCALEPDAAAGRWNDSRPMLRERWTHAWDTPSRTRFEGALDQFTAAWTDAAERACSMQHHAEATRCLRGQLGELRAVLETTTLATVDPRAHADVLVSNLGHPASCLQQDERRHRPPMPRDASLWPEVDRIRDAMARAEAFALATNFGTAASLSKATLVDAVELGYAPVEAEAMFHAGAAMAEVSEYADAVALLEQAYFDAEGLRHERLAARAAVRLVRLHGNRLRDEVVGRTWIRRAQAAVDRLADDDSLRADLAFGIGRFEHRTGHLERARDALRDAEARFAGLDRTFERERTMLARGEVELDAGNLEGGSRLFAAVLDARVQTLGDNHPYTALARSFVARGLVMRGELERAREEFVDAIAVLGGSIGTQHISVVGMLGNVGAIELELGFFESGLAHSNRALQTLQATLPPGHLALAVAYDNIAEIQLELGDAAQAHRLDAMALEIRTQTLPATHPHTIRSHAKLARSLSALGRRDDAEAALDEAQTRLAAGPSFDPETRLEVALAHVALNRRPVEELRALAGLIPEADVGHGIVRFELAKLLHPTQPAQAIAFAEEAIGTFDALGATPRSAVVRQWLQARGSRREMGEGE